MEYNEDVLQEIYDITRLIPGIDPPAICLELFKPDITDPEIPHAHDLAAWLNKHHKIQWETVCFHIDKLLETGDVVFTDDGEIYPAGYEGSL
tara:strand:- start:1215 stop:1490 length:276 start_codon:yes stop_codon:yes gene_type:complete